MASAQSMQISEFKARCIEVLREIDRTGQPLVVTLRGKPIAVVEPAPAVRALGTMEGECTLHGDLVTGDFGGEWDMNR